MCLCLRDVGYTGTQDLKRRELFCVWHVEQAGRTGLQITRKKTWWQPHHISMILCNRKEKIWGKVIELGAVYYSNVF